MNRSLLVAAGSVLAPLALLAQPSCLGIRDSSSGGSGGTGGAFSFFVDAGMGGGGAPVMPPPCGFGGCTSR